MQRFGVGCLVVYGLVASALAGEEKVAAPITAAALIGLAEAYRAAEPAKDAATAAQEAFAAEWKKRLAAYKGRLFADTVPISIVSKLGGGEYAFFVMSAFTQEKAGAKFMLSLNLRTDATETGALKRGQRARLTATINNIAIFPTETKPGKIYRVIVGLTGAKAKPKTPDILLKEFLPPVRNLPDPTNPHGHGSPFPLGKEPDRTHRVEVYWTTQDGMETRVTVKAPGQRPTQVRAHLVEGDKRDTLLASIHPDCNHRFYLVARLPDQREKNVKYLVGAGEGTVQVDVFGFKAGDFSVPPEVTVEYVRAGKTVGRTVITAKRPVSPPDPGEQRLAPEVDLKGAGQRMRTAKLNLFLQALQAALAAKDQSVAGRKAIWQQHLPALKQIIFAYPGHSGPAHAAGASAYEKASRELAQQLGVAAAENP